MNKSVDQIIYLVCVILIYDYVKWISVNTQLLKVVVFVVLSVIVQIWVFINNVSQGDSILPKNG